MIPEKLVLKGIYSYSERTEIDFATLAEAELFGIFGHVGSGKSAILEAVTYVLYGKIERMGQIGLYYNMMNLRSDEMEIDFVFRHGGKRYRFCFKTKRKKKDFECIESPVRAAYEEDGGEWVPLFDKGRDVTAEGILGLSYENFMRTVIIPQGRFQDFLHLDKVKRTDMMKDLFGLRRFDLSQKAGALYNANEKRLAAVEGALSGLEDAGEEELAELSAEEAVITERLPGLVAEIESASKDAEEFRKIEELGGKLDEVRRELNKSLDAADTIAERKRFLESYISCERLFRPLLASFSAAEKDEAEAAEEAGRLAADRASAADVLERARGLFAEASLAAEGLDRLRLEQSWLEALVSAVESDKEAAGLLEKIRAQERLSGRLKSEKDAAAAAAENAADSLRMLRRRTDRLEDLSGLYRWYEKRRESESEAAAVRTRIEERRCEAAEAFEDFLRHPSVSLLRTEGLLPGVPSGFEEAAAALEDVRQLMKIEEETFSEAKKDAGIRKAVAELGAGLEPGKPCPVCGSTEHPGPFVSGAEIPGFNAVEQRLDRLRGAAEDYSKAIAECRLRRGTAFAASAEMERRLEELGAGTDDGDASVFVCGFGPDNEEEFRAEWGRLQAERAELPALEAEENRLRAAAAAAAAAPEKASAELNRLQIEYHRLDARAEELKSRIDPDFLDDLCEREPEAVRTMMTDLAAKIAETESTFRSASTSLKDAEILCAKLEEGVSGAEKGLQKCRTRTSDIRKQIADVLEASAFGSLEQVRSILDCDLDADAERAEIENFERRLELLRTEELRLHKEMNGRTYDGEAHSGILSKLSECSRERDALMARQGALSARRKELEKRLSQKAEFEREQKALMIRRENIGVLKALFRGQRFVNYVLTVYLSQLCAAANDRFRKLTRESLRLETDSDNNFIIRDYLNDGRTRSVRTLSGGQTFQAAFSLALALADSIGRERAEFFFLDEGFGSLDRESLELVFDSLKSLKKENRTVGVISHVEELKQEIDTYLTVRKDEETGSCITCSWEI